MTDNAVILVTGGAGYVGAHTCKALAQKGFRPVVFDNLSTGHLGFVRWGEFERGDIRDTATVKQAIQRHRPIAILHFAASAYVRESIVNPAQYYNNNVVGSLSLLEAMRASECRNIVFSSTCAVYGEPISLPISETTPCVPVSPYGASKWMVERILTDFDAAYGMRSMCLRYFNASGADQETQIGELREPETHLIARAMMSLLGYISDFEVFGTHFDTPDGTAIRDYIHVSDLADAHVAALHRLLVDAPSGIFNLGTGTGHSVREVLKAVRDISGRTLPEVRAHRQIGEPARLVADPTLARVQLSFRPWRSDLDTIVRTAWAWHQQAHPLRSEPPTV